MKKLVYMLLFLSLLSGCATLFYSSATLVDKRDNKLTLKYFTGRKPNWYDDNFERAAKDLCPGGYDVLEKTYKPTTLTVFDEESAYYWVVRCK